LDLIDAEGLVDAPAGAWESARAHTRQCSRCAEAFNAAEVLSTKLRALARPTLTRDFSVEVVQRIRLAQVSDPDSAFEEHGEARSDVLGWGFAAGALASALVAWAAAPVGGWAAALISVRLAPSAWLPMNPASSSAVWIAMALVFSVLAWRAPVRASK
jgi:hypothetical protein